MYRAKPNCPICEGFGWVRRDADVGDPDFGKAFPCRCTQPRQSYVNAETGECYEPEYEAVAAAFGAEFARREGGA